MNIFKKIFMNKIYKRFLNMRNAAIYCKNKTRRKKNCHRTCDNTDYINTNRLLTGMFSWYR